MDFQWTDIPAFVQAVVQHYWALFGSTIWLLAEKAVRRWRKSKPMSWRHVQNLIALGFFAACFFAFADQRHKWLAAQSTLAKEIPDLSGNIGMIRIVPEFQVANHPQPLTVVFVPVEIHNAGGPSTVGGYLLRMVTPKDKFDGYPHSIPEHLEFPRGYERLSDLDISSDTDLAEKTMRRPVDRGHPAVGWLMFIASDYVVPHIGPSDTSFGVGFGDAVGGQPVMVLADAKVVEDAFSLPAYGTSYLFCPGLRAP